MLVEHVPLDNYTQYSTPVSNWIKDGSVNHNPADLSFYDRIQMFQKALDLIITHDDVHFGYVYELRDEPHIYIQRLNFEENTDDFADLIYWFIFKEDNNGTTHKVGFTV